MEILHAHQEGRVSFRPPQLTFSHCYAFQKYTCPMLHTHSVCKSRFVQVCAHISLCKLAYTVTHAMECRVVFMHDFEYCASDTSVACKLVNYHKKDYKPTFRRTCTCTVWAHGQSRYQACGRFETEGSNPNPKYAATY